MKFKLFLSLIIICLSCALFADSLSDYVAKDDGAFNYKLENTQLSSDQSISISHVSFTSQEWLGKKFEHNVDIYYPSTAQVKGTALMLVVKGEYSSDWLQSASYIANFMQSPVVVLYANPKNVTRDDFSKDYLEKILNDPNFLSCPFAYANTKTIVKAMDVVGELTHELYDTPIDNFVLCGGDFKALSIWLTASLNDSRVKGIIPVCFDVINILEQINNQKEVTGELTEKYLDDIDAVNQEKVLNFIKITDPFYRLKDITVPKLIVSATGDPVATVDSKKFYFDQLVGNNNHMYTVVNETSVWPDNQAYKYSTLGRYTNLLNTVKSFFYNVTQNKKYEITKFEWVKTSKGYCLHISCNPTNVVAAYSYVCDSDKKDFRYANFNKKELTLDNNQYSLDVELPENSHRCAFVEIQYTSEIGVNYSEFSIPFIIK